MMLRIILGFFLCAALQAPASADCTDELKAILKHVLDSGPFHVDGTLSTNGHDSVLAADMVPPDAMHTQISTAGKTLETVKIGKKLWIKDGKSWRQVPELLGAIAGKMPSGLDNLTPDLVQGGKCLGPQTLDGTSYQAYSFKLDMQDGLFSAEGLLYVDPKTNLLARQTIDADMFGVKNHTEKRFTFDPAIKIEPPK